MKTIHFIIGIILSGFVFIGCGASKKASPSDLGSLDGVNRDDNSVNVKFLANCNRFTRTDINLKGVITAYYDLASQQYIPDLIRLELKNVPNALTASSTYYIQFFKWLEEVEGQKQFNSQPVGMFFQNSNGQWLNNSPINTLSQSQIDGLISANNLSGVTRDNFFTKVLIVLSGMDLQYDAMTVATFDSSIGGAVQNSIDVLLPAFAADPNLYAVSHTTTLQQLHPNYLLRSSGLTEWDYFLKTQELCL